MSHIIARSMKRRFYVRYEIIDACGVLTVLEARVASPDPALVTPPPGTRTFSFFAREEGYETTDDGNTQYVRKNEECLFGVYNPASSRPT